MSGVLGEGSCWRVHNDDRDDRGDETCRRESAVVVDLGSTTTRDRAGVVWSMSHGGDLVAHLVHLAPDDVIEAHIDSEFDLVISVMTGRGHMTVDGETHSLRGDVLALVRKGARREIRAGSTGLTYLTIRRDQHPEHRLQTTRVRGSLRTSEAPA
jgi:quercetin dioxygenase-like cupin family protein